MGVELAFGIAGGVILVGVLANLVSKRFNIPDIPLLIVLGIALGPVTGLIQVGSLAVIAPFFSALAVTVILFEGGIRLRLARVASQLGRALSLVVSEYLICVFVVGLALAWFMKWPPLVGMVLGSALGGSSTVAVFSLLKRTQSSEKVAAIVSLDAALNDIPILVVTAVLIEILSGTAGSGIAFVLQSIVQSFVIGGVIGVVGGIVWLKMLEKLGDEPYKDIATIGFLLGAYAVSQALNGSGVMSALMIGLIVGNSAEVRRLAGMKEAPLVEGVSRRFHEQISFALRTFFFVYLGLFLSLSDPIYLLIGGGVSLLLLGARYLAVMISTTGDSILRMDTGLMTMMFPRGLSNAVMAQSLILIGIPASSSLLEIAVSTIFWSVVFSSVVVVLFPGHLSFNLNVPGLGSGRLPHLRQRNMIPAAQRFRAEVKEAVEELPGVKFGMKPFVGSYGPFEPLAAFSKGKQTLIVDALMGLDEVKQVPSKVKSCQDAKFHGELDFVIDDLTAFKALTRLLLVEEYCDRSQTLGFKVRLFSFEPHAKNKLVPLRQMKSMLAPEAMKKSRLGGIMEAVQRVASRQYEREGAPA
ncbi:MAG: cation:proton antiporter [Nitrososphaerota archaeon]|nr:cation:proton antiporter [Nitrososphaerota archaeon]